MSDALGCATRLEHIASSLRSRQDWADTDDAIDLERAARELRRLHGLINTAQTGAFLESVRLEMAHQRERWGAQHDAGKKPSDWFWLIGYLAGKALHALVDGNIEKAMHHVITSAAALGNWYLQITGEDTSMRPGIASPETTDA